MPSKECILRKLSVLCQNSSAHSHGGPSEQTISFTFPVKQGIPNEMTRSRCLVLLALTSDKAVRDNLNWMGSFSIPYNLRKKPDC